MVINFLLSVRMQCGAPLRKVASPAAMALHAELNLGFCKSKQSSMESWKVKYISL